MNSLTTYYCANGHVWEGSEDDVSLSFWKNPPKSTEETKQEWMSRREKLSGTGPLCPFCICKDLKNRYGVSGIDVAKRPMRVYVASSWRNSFQQSVVAAIRGIGMEVYDFRHPSEGDYGFSWSQCASKDDLLSPRRFRDVLSLAVPQAAFKKDMTALAGADVTVLVLPCGRSAHLELGWAAGHGQRTIVLFDDPISEPELMYLACTDLCIDLADVLLTLRRWDDDGYRFREWAEVP
jgi:hypothetical protein